MTIHDLDTPALTIDLDILEKNIRETQEACDKCDIPLRVHTKTHKIPEIARMQLAAGAIGIVCQKVGEAEAMVEAGIPDILIPYNIVGPIKVKRLAELCKRATMTVAVDSEITARGLSDGATENNATINILIECDTGGNRCGVQSPKAALELAQKSDNHARPSVPGHHDLSQQRTRQSLHRPNARPASKCGHRGQHHQRGRHGHCRSFQSHWLHRNPHWILRL